MQSSLQGLLQSVSRGAIQGMKNMKNQNDKLQKILSMKDSREKLIKLSDFMFHVAVGCYEWNLARAESQRVQANGIDF